jgi:hypothetical protein
MHMIYLLKRLLPREPLPAYLHVHVDVDGNDVLCDESACRPARRSEPRFFTSLR